MKLSPTTFRRTGVRQPLPSSTRVTRLVVHAKKKDSVKRFDAGGPSAEFTVTKEEALEAAPPPPPPSPEVEASVTPSATNAEPSKPRVVVVGSGFAGFGTAYHLSKQGYAVTIVDAAANPGGLSAGWVTKEGQKVEAGVKGFWYEYFNIFQLLKELDLPEWPLTKWTTSGLWSPRGLVTEAPVFSELTPLPTLLGQFVHTFDKFTDLPLADRASMLPLMLALLDYKTSEENFRRYDQMTARELFRSFGLSSRMYDVFLKQILLVGLFAPPEDLSAAVVLETFYYYALAHQDSFDVCWARGTVAEKILEPLRHRIESYGGQVVGSTAVEDVLIDQGTGRIKGVLANNWEEGKKVAIEADAVVFAVGITGMQKIVQASKTLSEREEFRNVMQLKGLDVMSTRLVFERRVDTRFPANVITNFIPDCGGTFFNLNVLQDEWKDSPNAVIAADFYHSNTLMPLSDEEVVRKVSEILATCEPGFRDNKVIDYAVLRFPKAVSHFSAGSLAYRPRQTTSFPNVFIAGDWVKGLEHGANGLSQERAYVTGMAAANLVMKSLGKGTPVEIIPVRPDEPHIAIPSAMGKATRGFFESMGIYSPFL